MFSYLYSFTLKHSHTHTKVYWMYNFHIYVHYMKSSTACVCAYSRFLLLMCLLDLAIVRTSEEEEELSTLSIREHTRTVRSKMFNRDANKEKRFAASSSLVFLSLIILTECGVVEVLSDRLCGLLINYWTAVLYEKKRKTAINQAIDIEQIHVSNSIFADRTQSEFEQGERFEVRLLRNELYHRPLYYTSCVTCGTRFLPCSLLKIIYPNKIFYWWLLRNHHINTFGLLPNLIYPAIMQIGTIREERIV